MEETERAKSGRTEFTATELRAASQAWESFMRAQSLLSREFAKDPAWKEGSMREYDVLYTLVKGGRPLRQGELLDQVLLSQPALSRLLSKMVDRGLLIQSTDPSDARSAFFTPSEQGLALQRRLGKAHGEQIAKRLYGALSPEQVTQLRALSEQLCSPLSKA